MNQINYQSDIVTAKRKLWRIHNLQDDILSRMLGLLTDLRFGKIQGADYNSKYNILNKQLLSYYEEEDRLKEIINSSS